MVQLIRDGVTGMDLLEVFLQRHIQPLQARDHSMWMYSGLEDSTRIHPEEVDDDTLEKWLSGTRTIPGELGEFPHSTNLMHQSRSDSEFLLVI